MWSLQLVVCACEKPYTSENRPADTLSTPGISSFGLIAGAWLCTSASAPRDRDRRKDEVDVHAVAPAERLGEHAAEDQSDRGPAAGDRAPDPERLVALARVSEGGRHQRQRGRRKQRRECALERARGGEHPERLGGPADGGRGREPGQAGDERPLAPQQIRDPAAEQQQAAERQRVRGHDPLPIRVGEMQRPLRRRAARYSRSSRRGRPSAVRSRESSGSSNALSDVGCR